MNKLETLLDLTPINDLFAPLDATSIRAVSAILISQGTPEAVATATAERLIRLAGRRFSDVEAADVMPDARVLDLALDGLERVEWLLRSLERGQRDLSSVTPRSSPPVRFDILEDEEPREQAPVARDGRFAVALCRAVTGLEPGDAGGANLEAVIVTLGKLRDALGEVADAVMPKMKPPTADVLAAYGPKFADPVSPSPDAAVQRARREALTLLLSRPAGGRPRVPAALVDLVFQTGRVWRETLGREPGAGRMEGDAYHGPFVRLIRTLAAAQPPSARAKLTDTVFAAAFEKLKAEKTRGKTG